MPIWSPFVRFRSLNAFLRRFPLLYSGLVAVLTISTFLGDLMLPLGVGDGFPYAVLIVFSLSMPWGWAPFYLATIMTALTVVGYFLSPGSDIGQAALVNRAVAIVAIWIVAILLRQRKAMEAELEIKRAAAENASAAKSRFLANMSHELRTPLNAIIGFSDVMKNELLGSLGSSRYVEYAEGIHRSGGHLLEIITDVLDMARVESGKVELLEGPCDLRSIAETCIGIVADSARRSGVEVVLSAAADLPTLIGDGRLLRQMLLNLLSNAVKFTPPSGQVSVAVRLVEDGGMEMVVTDTGVGMNAADLATAMEPFTRIRDATTSGVPGTGLGLPMAKSLAELHGGRLLIDSVPGSGTRATVILPPRRVLRAERAGSRTPPGSLIQLMA
ncbi:MAG: HAMP domain-containing sensor histidine kinase [Dongiaceae bacterium]